MTDIKFTPQKEDSEDISFRPLADRVIIQPDKAQESISLLDEHGKTKELHLTEGAREKPYTGIVVRVGDGDLGSLGKKEMVLKKGDKVFYSKFAGTDIILSGISYLILKESEIYGVLE